MSHSCKGEPRLLESSGFLVLRPGMKSLSFLCSLFLTLSLIVTRFNEEKTKHPVNGHPVIFGTKSGHETGPQGSNRDAALCDESHTLGAPFGLPPGPGEGPGGAQKLENIMGWGCFFCS